MQKSRFNKVVEYLKSPPVALGLSPRGVEPRPDRKEPVLEEYSPGKRFEQLERDFSITDTELEFNSYSQDTELNLSKIYDSIVSFIDKEKFKHYPYRNSLRFSCFSLSVINVSHDEPIYTLCIDEVRIVSQKFRWKDMETGEVFHGLYKTHKPYLELVSTEVKYEEFMPHVLVLQKYVVPKAESVKAKEKARKDAENRARIASALQKVMK